ncbi:unnamed protein product [Schistosoma turkestanicum]|nr:unnamed protein product [Schistosoma turkestanicum]
MLTELINFDCNKFRVDDSDVDHEDPILKQELNHLILEQLSNFDLSDEEDQLGSVEDDAVPADSNDLMSILEAGKLSLLEGAIQDFGKFSGDETTNSSELTNPRNDGEQSRNNQEFLKSTDQFIPNIHSFQNPENIKNKSEKSGSHNSNHSICNNFHTQTKDGSSGPAVSLDLSLPDEMANALSDVAQHNVIPCATQASNEPGKTTPLKNQFISCFTPIKTSIANEKIDPHFLPDDKQDRRELIYAAQGHQLQELQAEVIQLKEYIAKEKRLSNHRLLLDEGEKETLRSKLSATEDIVKSLYKELAAKEENSEVLQKQLQQNEESQKKLNEELLALRSTNESLSSQLIELTTGNALKRAEEREAQLTESLEQRFMSKTDELKAELNTTQRHLTEKEVEVIDLRRQLEISKAEMLKSQQTYNEMINEANKQLEEAQKHCQQLASSALCSEVTLLRQKVIELETSKRITDDVNKILQNELRDFRDQVSIYESVLKLDVYSMNNGIDENQLSYDTSEFTPISIKGRHSGKSVAFADTIEPIHHANLRRRRPCSAVEQPIHRTDDNVCTIASWNSDEQNYRFQRNSGDKQQPCINSDDLADKAGEYDEQGDLFHSLTRQGILTSTPAVSVISPKSPMAKLRNELERCLLNYKAKREQVTKLHEILYTTRCQLHQSREASEKAEKSAKLLQERVLSLEQELSTLRIIGDNPGPRELLLSGQLERLRGDYNHLEEELQATRTRLQAALGAEAKALEAEKTISERLAASAAERDAAVERAKAMCEAQYIAMRRHLEAEWANERDTNTRRAEEKLADTKKALYEMEREVHRITNLYHESQISAKKAVENALMEAMKLREAERMRFWRQELPEQIEVARQSWISQMKTQNSEDKGSQTEMCLPVNTAVNTSYIAESTACVQTELNELLPLRFGITIHDPIQDNFMNNEIKTAILSKYPILSEYLSAECLLHLCTHLTETSCINLCYLEKEIANSSQTMFKHLLQNLLKQIDGEIDRLMQEYKVAHIFDQSVKWEFSSGSQSIFKRSDPDTLSYNSFDQSDEILKQTFSNYLNFNNFKIQLFKMINCEYQSILEKIHLLIVNLDNAKNYVQQLNNVSVNVTTSIPSEHKSIQVNGLEAEYYSSTIKKIKADVLNYVELCQSRAAQILHSELGRVHRRACRQFTSQLRQALLEAGAPICSTTRRGNFYNRAGGFTNSIDSNFNKNKYCHVNKISETINLSEASDESDFQTVTTSPTPNSYSELESLLHIIDEVCASTEAKFYADTLTGSRLFSQFNVAKSLSDDKIIPQTSINNNNTSLCNNLTTISSHNIVTYTPYIVPDCKQNQSLSMSSHCCSHFKQNSNEKLSIKAIIPNQCGNQMYSTNRLLSRNNSTVCSNHFAEDLSSHITASMNSIALQLKSNNDNNLCKPIPTPRVTRLPSVNLINRSPRTIMNGCQNTKPPVHAQLYELFESFIPSTK